MCDYNVKSGQVHLLSTLNNFLENMYDRTTLFHQTLTELDPDLKKNAKNYRDNHEHRYAAEIILHFINVKY